MVTTWCFVLSGLLMIWTAWQLLMRRGVTESLGRTLAMHTVTGLAFALLWTLLFGGLIYLIFMPIAERDGFHKGLIWQVVWGFMTYVGLAQVARTQTRLREQELAAAQAELVALRSQLNPHFLFNTLHALTQLIRDDPAGTRDALERFGDLMRYVLHAGNNATAEVTVEDELEFVEHYLALEQLRLGDRLGVYRHIDPETLELALPPLLLQPLVENAVRHGVAPRREGGAIRLTTQMAEERLLIEVADDGKGSETNAWRHSQGLGLKSVMRQLQAWYSTAAEFDVQTRPGEGFTVQISIPARVPRKVQR
jgi:sensor histidine kinase YesM